MSENKIRIETLRKEKTHENFKNSGITTLLLEDFKIALPKDYAKLPDFKISETVFNSVLRQMVKKVEETIHTYEDLVNFAEMISFGSNKVTIVPLSETTEDNAFQDYMITLLKSCAKVSCTNHEVYEKYLPSKLTYTISNLSGSYKEEAAYTLGSSKMPKRIHGRTWAMTRQKKYKYELIVDVTKIFTKVFLYNTVETFLINNQDLYCYKFAKKFLEFSSNRSRKESGIVRIPEELDSRLNLLNTFKKYDLVEDELKIEFDSGYDRYGTKILLGYNAETNSITNFNSSMYDLMLIELINQTVYIKDKVDRAIRETSDYARSFQTKKHINLKTQEVMKNNAFLKNYGYVELDNDVELKKFNVLEKEFEELGKKIYIPKCDNHSFRIKKLGHHRAAGLYYPAPVRATIFDLDYPTAYCHELGHQMDYALSDSGAMLSETVRFMPVIELYKDAVNETVENMNESSSFKAAWNGKSKYNASYYFLPTEIFARTFEMYLTFKGIETSFLPKTLDTPVYPMENEELQKTIINYFDELFAPYKSEVTKELVDELPTNQEQTEVQEQLEQTIIKVTTNEEKENVEDTNPKILVASSTEFMDNSKSVKKSKSEEDSWENSLNFEQLSLF